MKYCTRDECSIDYINVYKVINNITDSFKSAIYFYIIESSNTVLTNAPFYERLMLDSSFEYSNTLSYSQRF